MSLYEMYTLLCTITGMSNKVVLYDWPVNDGQLSPEEGIPSGLAASAPETPYICFRDIDPQNMMADGTVYYSVQRYEVTLYSSNKDPQTESAVESVLTGAGFYWSKQPGRLEDARAYITTYTIEV